MMSFDYILGNAGEGYKFIESLEKFNLLMNIDDIKLFKKKENNKNIQPGYKNAIRC